LSTETAGNGEPLSEFGSQVPVAGSWMWDTSTSARIPRAEDSAQLTIIMPAPISR